MNKRNYTIAGLTLAALVFALIVVAGTIGGGSSQTSQAAPVAGQPSTLPSGHPPIADGQQPVAGMTAGSDGELAAKIASLEKAHDQNPGDRKAGIALAEAYIRNEQADKALAVYAALLDATPDDATLRAQSAMAWHIKGNDERAMSILKDVLAATPDNQTGHYNLAIILFSQDQSAEAKKEWQAAAALDPESQLGVSAQSFVDLMEGRTPAPTASGHGQ